MYCSLVSKFSFASLGGSSSMPGQITVCTIDCVKSTAFCSFTFIHLRPLIDCHFDFQIKTFITLVINFDYLDVILSKKFKFKLSVYSYSTSLSHHHHADEKCGASSWCRNAGLLGGHSSELRRLRGRMWSSLRLIQEHSVWSRGWEDVCHEGNAL